MERQEYGDNPLESKKRSLVKSLVWRIIGIFVLGAITWAFTQNVEVTTAVTIIFHTIRFILYYIHERAWDKIEWGLVKKNELSEKEETEMMEKLKRLGYLE